MTPPSPKNSLRYDLQRGRDALLWKLEGLSEYDVRRPLVRTGTNLLGLVKHVASMDAGYFGDVFGRPFPEQFPWFAEGAEPNADMWAHADEARSDIIDLYRRVLAHSDETIDMLPLDAPGRVPWWPAAHAEVTLHQVLVHMVAETHRHAGHADLVRELIDGSAGFRPNNDNLPKVAPEWWDSYFQQLEEAARSAAAATGAPAQAS